MAERQARGLSFRHLMSLVQVQRLIRLADDPAHVRFVKDACARAGIGVGSRVVDIGCGPLGAMAVLSEVVGESGVVVGLDQERAMVETSRRILADRGLRQVSVFEQDVHTVDPEVLCPPGPFDAAYCRLLLINQRDPARTLRRMAALVRPGGRLIAHELLDDPAYPVFDPPVRAFTRFSELLYASLRIGGSAPDVARRYHTLAQEAGLEVESQCGHLNANPTDAPGFIQEQGVGLLLASRQAFVGHGLATEREIGQLLEELRAATQVTYRSFMGWIMIELIARRPT